MSFIDTLPSFTWSSANGGEVKGLSTTDAWVTPWLQSMLRMKLLTPHRYFHSIQTKFKLCPHEEICGGFAAVNATTYLLNPIGFSRIERGAKDVVGQMGMVNCHEFDHIGLLHPYRLESFANHDIANRAADTKINANIDEDNKRFEAELGYVPFPFLELDDEYGQMRVIHEPELAKGRHVPEIYQILVKREMEDQHKQQQQQQQQQQQGDGGQPQPQPQDGGQQQQQPQPQPQAGGQPTEEDIESAGARQTERSKSVNGGNVLRPEVPEGSTFEEEMKKAERQVEATNLSATIETQRNGNFNGLRSVRECEKAKELGSTIHWEEPLRDLLTGDTKMRYHETYDPELYSTEGILEDVRNKPDAIGEIAIAFDMSGSITDPQLANQIGRADEFVKNFLFDRIHLIPIDDAMGEVVELEHGDPFPDKLKKGGSGGTQLDLVFKHIEEEELNIKALFFFTDGHTNWGKMPQNEPDDYKVIWLNYGKNPNKYKWGEVIEVDLA